MVKEFFEIEPSKWVDEFELEKRNIDPTILYPKVIGDAIFQAGKAALADCSNHGSNNPMHFTEIKINLNNTYSYNPCCDKFDKTAFESRPFRWRIHSPPISRKG